MTSNKTKTEYQLEAETELRCESHEGETLILKLLKGTAEIFGVELVSDKEYSFTDENFAVFSWYGCKIEATIVSDNPISGGSMLSSVYKADSTPNIAYVNTHSQLEARRDVALFNQDYGPRVLIVGDVDHGKSSTSKMLIAYAARLDRTPIYVDLDVGQGSLSVTGVIGAVQVDKNSITVEDGYGNAMPLIYFFGHSSPKDNIPLYKLFVDILSENVRKRMDNDLDAKSSGMIINTCGWVEGSDAIDLIHHIINSFQVDVILVMNNDKLYASLFGLSSQGITVVKLPTSGGIVKRDQQVRRRLRKNRIKEYFYGKPNISPLAPARLEIKLSSVKFLRAGGYQLSEGMRSLGDDMSSQSFTDLVMIQPTADLSNSCLGVLNPVYDNTSNVSSSINSSNSSSGSNAMMTNPLNLSEEDIPHDLIRANIAGFIVVIHISLDQNSMTVLSPCPGALPSKYLLVGSIKWVEK